MIYLYNTYSYIKRINITLILPIVFHMESIIGFCFVLFCFVCFFPFACWVHSDLNLSLPAPPKQNFFSLTQ